MDELRKDGMVHRRRVSFGIRTAAPAVAIAALLTGCVGGGDSGDGDGDNGQKDGGGAGKGGNPGDGVKPIASADDTVLNFSAKTDIMKLQRTSDDMVFLSFRITNTSDESGEFFSELSMQDEGQVNSPGGITLIDQQNMKHYLPQSYENTDCYCTVWDNTYIEPDEPLEAWVVFPAPPKNIKKLSVDIPTSPIIADVPLSDGGEIPEEPVGELRKPRIRDLRQVQEDLEEGTAREENNDETKVMLSSDVLFDLNKSDLTSKADSSLKKVAKEIDESSAKTVKVDGYTDDSGDDSINQPLSEDRAEEVTKKLKSLVTRDGVKFESSGHGSADPVASNDTDEGRQKNRRVSVRFAK